MSASRAEHLSSEIQQLTSSECPQVITQAEPPYRILSVNRVWELVCGYQQSEVLGKTCRILQGPQTCMATLFLLREALAQKEGLRVRVLNYTKEGVPFTNELEIEPLFVKGQVQFFKGTICSWAPPNMPTDFLNAIVTEEEQAALQTYTRNMPRKLHEALKLSQNTCMVITERDPPFAITHCSSTWSRVCGWAAEEAIGKTCRIMQGPLTCRNTIAALNLACKTGVGIAVRLVNYTKVAPPIRERQPMLWASAAARSTR